MTRGRRSAVRSRGDKRSVIRGDMKIGHEELVIMDLLQRIGIALWSMRNVWVRLAG